MEEEEEAGGGFSHEGEETGGDMAPVGGVLDWESAGWRRGADGTDGTLDAVSTVAVKCE